MEVARNRRTEQRAYQGMWLSAGREDVTFVFVSPEGVLSSQGSSSKAKQVLQAHGVILHYNTMKIDLKSSLPIYQQIAEAIRAKIAIGVYRPGEGLPSIRSLAIKLKVNQNTVHKAYGELEAAGLITQRRGLGMFVTNRAAATAKTRARRAALDSVRRALSQCHAAGLIQDDVLPLIMETLPATSGEESSN